MFRVEGIILHTLTHPSTNTTHVYICMVAWCGCIIYALHKVAFLFMQNNIYDMYIHHCMPLLIWDPTFDDVDTAIAQPPAVLAFCTLVFVTSSWLRWLKCMLPYEAILPDANISTKFDINSRPRLSTCVRMNVEWRLGASVNKCPPKWNKCDRNLLILSVF